MVVLELILEVEWNDLCFSLEFRDELGMACDRFQAKIELALIPKLMEGFKGKKSQAMNFQEPKAKEESSRLKGGTVMPLPVPLC